ncbi:MAG: DUF2797 domain-containing protein [Leptospiraceae bacterium]|nr:DUF2797 domain-containing protein [Leptospiraceae bacterium]
MMVHSGLDPVNYEFEVVNYKEVKKRNAFGEIEIRIPLNELIGKKIKLEFSGEIRCVNCGTISKKSFGQGNCFKCFMNLASNDMCILRPEDCHFHLGTCREPEWGKKNCFKSHIVYLANTSGLKVGITKENPHSKRWVDQGAVEAIPIYEVESRIDAGKIEVEFAKFISDKTSWQKMIAGPPPQIDLLKSLKELKTKVNLKAKVEKFKELKIGKSTKINYPVEKYPSKKKSLKPDKDLPIEDIVVGIKGQYLLFENGVINLRSQAGQYCKLSKV